MDERLASHTQSKIRCFVMLSLLLLEFLLLVHLLLGRIGCKQNECPSFRMCVYGHILYIDALCSKRFS